MTPTARQYRASRPPADPDRPPGARLVVGAVALALALMSAGAAPALAATDAALTGTVRNQTTGTTVGGIEVTLHRYQGDSEIATTTATAAPDGSFAFSGLAAGGTWQYAVTTKFQEGDYQSPRTALAAGETKTVELTVYDARTSSAGMSIDKWIVWIDREAGGAAVQYDLEVDNAGNTAFVGDRPVAGGKRAVLRLPIPSGAGSFQYLDFFMQCCAIVQGRTFVHTMSMSPGVSTGTVRFSTRSLSQLVLTPPWPTASMTLIVPQGMRVVATGFEASGTTQDRGTTYAVFGASNLAAGAPVVVGIPGLSSRRSPALFGAAIGSGLAVVLAVLLVGRRRARRARRTRPATGRNRATPATSATSVLAPAPVPTPIATDGEADLLVDELAALDLAFERGLVAEDTYRRVRAARKARLVELRAGAIAR